MPDNASSTFEPSETNDDQQGVGLSLVEFEPGVALVLGEGVLEGMELTPFSLIRADEQQDLEQRIAVAVGAANVVAQVGEVAKNVQGLVRLAPETVAALKTLDPIVSGGWNIGTLADQSGKFAHSVRWLPATGVQTATFVSALGPAATLLALQAQVAAISRKVDENISLTNDVLKAIHQDQWATLTGLQDTTAQALREAQAVGYVDSHIYSALASKDADLRKQRHLFTTMVKDHVVHLGQDVRQRRNYLQKHAERIVADVQGMLIAEGSWYRAQTLRAANILHEGGNSSGTETLLRQVTSDTRREHAHAMDVAADLIEQLEASSRLSAELPAEKSLPFGAKSRTAKEVSAMADALANKMEQLHGRLRPRPAVLSPEVAVFRNEIPTNVLEILRWARADSNPLLLLADVNLDRMIGENGYLGVTRDVLFFGSQADVRKRGEIDQEVPLDDIRYVRQFEGPKSVQTLDVITKDENFRFTFDSWAQTSDGRAKVDRLANILRAAMRLPEEEKRTDPLILPRDMEPGLEVVSG